MTNDFRDIAVRAEQRAFRELADVSLRHISDEDIIMAVCDEQEFVANMARWNDSRAHSRNHRFDGDRLG